MTVQTNTTDNFETFDGTFPLLEELLSDMEEQKPDLFIQLDWLSLSSVKYWSHNFIREFFEFFNINVLLTCQMFTEEFLIEIIEVLIPRSKNSINVNTVIKAIHSVYNVSVEFKNKYSYSDVNTFKPKKVKKIYKVNTSFENIINYIQTNNLAEYNRLDLKALSSFKLLSEDFICRHFEKLDKNMLFTHQKMTNSFISMINDYNGIPFNCLLISHLRQLNLEFIFELNFKFLKNPKYLAQIQRNILNGTLDLFENNDEKYFFRNKTGINDDTTILINPKKTLIATNSLDTFFLDGM